MRVSTRHERQNGDVSLVEVQAPLPPSPNSLQMV